VSAVRIGLLGLAALWAGVLPAGSAAEGSHRAPAESLAGRAALDERGTVLAEMWQRGILSPDANQWGPEDMALLQRIRQAEAAGALALLRQRLLSLKAFTVREKSPGLAPPRIRLNRRGFDKYLMIRTQDALQYFEAKGVETKWAYGLTDLQGRSLFDRGSGMLSEAGEELYARVRQNAPVFWKTRAGDVMGNRPPAGIPPLPTPR
jgi:hypothetical protein